MVAQIQSLETRYKNTQFRSRCEARIAMLFDLFQIGWSYEMEGFDVDGRWYLPDFCLPKLQCFWEVKGFSEQVDAGYREMLINFSSQIQKPIILSVGNPKLRGYTSPDLALRDYDGFSLVAIMGKSTDDWAPPKPFNRLLEVWSAFSGLLIQSEGGWGRSCPAVLDIRKELIAIAPYGNGVFSPIAQRHYDVVSAHRF